LTKLYRHASDKRYSLLAQNVSGERNVFTLLAHVIIL